ncbi:MAG: aminotransferase class V-fold PLP-dependent enzyme [Acholeplasma sp.]|nr:aminotransferase class V-fold PLP-dependent enzyme [Acholeplasma sp.]
MIKTYPLESMSIEEAKERQFKIIDLIMQEFNGTELLYRGDLGVRVGENKPLYTKRIESVIARFFNTEDCVLVRGAGTAAIRYSLHAACNKTGKILVHDAPIYNTTKSSLDMLKLEPVYCDFNDLNNIPKVLKKHPDINLALVQMTRQKIEDSYKMEDVIKEIKKNKNIPIITDDNYAVNKVRKIGVELGADVSAFSGFKLLGPEGIGIIVGKSDLVKKIKDEHYSGGIQVQGHEALDVLQGLIYSPVLLAIQATVGEEVVKRLNEGEVKEVKNAFIANAQSKVIIVEFKENIAKSVLQKAEKLGAMPSPVGSESKYENVPLFYRVSGTFRKENPEFEERMIRINPFRGGADTIIRVLKEALK